MLFLHCHIFHDVRITFFCGTFALRIEITLKLGSVFVHYYDVFFIASKLRYLFVQCTYVFLQTLELRYILVRSNYV